MNTQGPASRQGPQYKQGASRSPRFTDARPLPGRLLGSEALERGGRPSWHPPGRSLQPPARSTFKAPETVCKYFTSLGGCGSAPVPTGP